MEIPLEWDKKLAEVMETVFSGCGMGYEKLGYKAKTTIKQLMHINSRLWTAKALSVGESLGLRVIYPYIWHDVLVEQGKLPWSVKIYNGIVKWPLKRLLEEIVPPRILDELLSDALNGKKLRFPVLNFLWSAIFTEMWIQKYR